MTTLSASLRLRPTRIGFLVSPTDMEAIRRFMQLSTCLWGGFYNPIIPVSSTIPDVWKAPHLPDPNGLRLAKGYLDFFEPDVFVEAQSGLAAQVGLADTEIDIGHSRVMPLDAFFNPNHDHDSRMPFGLNIFDLYKDLYEREFKFVPKHDRRVALFESGSSDDDAFVEAACGGFSKSGPLEPLAQVYIDAFDPEKLRPNATNWAKVLKDGFRVPLHFTIGGLRRDPEASSDPVLFVVDPTSAPDLLDLWNIRQFHPHVLPVNLNWMTASHDFLAEFITANHRPLPGNPYGVMIQTTIQVGRSISEERARAAVEEAGLIGLPPGSWSFKLWYDHIWKADRDDYVWRPRRARISAKSTDLELTVSTENGALSVRFPTLSPDFASVYSNGHARWVNVLKFRSYGSYGTEETFALTLPSSFIEEGPLQLRLGSVTIVSHEGFVLPQQYKDHREYLHLMTGRQAVIHWLGRNGVTADPSDPGRIADQVLSALGGFWGVQLIADRETLHLLNKMAKSIRKYSDETVEEFPDRTADVREWESLLARRRNGRFARELNLDPFVKANILKLGISIQCPNCMKKNWYGIGSLKEQLTCERCLKAFDFPQGHLDFRNTPWQYRVVGPFSVPDYAGGAYATVLALRVFARNLGMGDTKLTYAIGLNVGLQNEKPFEVDFTFWYQRDHLLDHAEEPALAFGEAKSFAVGSFEAKDITRMRKLAEKFPGAFLVFAMLKDALAEYEKAEIAALAMWGRELLDDGRPRAPVIVLTGTELFCEWNIEQAWRALSDQRGQFAARPALNLDNLWTLADLTQQVYLGLPDRFAALHEQLAAIHPRAPEGGNLPFNSASAIPTTKPFMPCTATR